jgi:hypothetical protein
VQKNDLPSELMAKIGPFKVLLEQHNQGNPIKSYLIENILGITGPDVRRIAHFLNIDGYGICSNNEGYYFSNDIPTLISYRDSLMARGDSIISKALGVARLIVRLQMERDKLGPQGKLL